MHVNFNPYAINRILTNWAAALYRNIGLSSKNIIPCRVCVLCGCSIRVIETHYLSNLLHRLLFIGWNYTIDRVFSDSRDGGQHLGYQCLRYYVLSV